MAKDARSMGKSGYYFTNWATTYSCKPELYFEPETTEEIQKILTFAQEKGKKVKVVGKGHSPSDLACTTDYMISLRRYSKVLNVNKEKQQVTVQGGCLVKDLNQKVLPKHGLAFSVLGTVSDLTVAGVISTGTHGTGANYGIISSYIVELELMTASGEVIHISKEDNSELMPAAVLSLGALGIILNVTLQCEPAFNLLQKQNPGTLKDVIENLDVYVTASDHFRFFWFPYTDNVICYHASRTKQEPNAKSSWLWDSFIGFHVLQLLYWVSTFVSALVPVINRVYYHVVYAHCSEKIDASHRIFNFDCLFRQYVMEWAIPREKVGVVLTEINSWIQTNGFPAHFPVEVRFVKEDDIYLSPAYGRDSCYINIIMYRPYDRYVSNEKYWDVFERIVATVGGRPHWAKDHKYGGEDFKALYPKWGEFCQLRKKLDPNGMFLNANLEQVFGKSSGQSKSSTIIG
ncbi:L-gulonolactone oxidase-like [Littorina saxatilis]|uniref:L-gulonolactone oxidase-like n=1 Tax=Littorina saxatilis TaxID=31220 RepID=UPI0038B45487